LSSVGRNAPCPCGSGKKFKKCCFGKSNSENSIDKERNQIIPSYDKINYGEPLLDDFFFKMNTLNELSASRFLYSVLITPGVEDIALNITNQFIIRGEAERKIIENTNDIKKLVSMVGEVDSINHVLLQKRLVQYKETSIPLILNEIKKPVTSEFIELAIKIIYASSENYSDKIIEIIKNHQRAAYPISQLCMLLGFYDNKNSEKLLWNYYHYFKENFCNETYKDGPLLGLIEIRARRNERMIFKNSLHQKVID
jgi:hypothetical protein